VTGAGGFIGSHLAERLAELGAELRALVHYNSLGSWGWLEQSPWQDRLQVVAGDITDRDRVADLVKDQEYLFHLAALIAIPYSYHAPESYVRTNVRGTLNLLQCAPSPPGCNEWSIRLPARCTARHGRCRLAKTIRSRGSPPIGRVRSPRTKWRKRFTCLSVYRW
jgi:GDP-mannose 4,6 dehydratase